MKKTIQIGNLGYSMDDRDLARLFAPYGVVHSAEVSTHFETGLSTGVGFVKMESDAEADRAIAALHGHTHCGRVLSVCWSREFAMPAAIHGAMFGPMNMSIGVRPAEAIPDRAS